MKVTVGVFATILDAAGRVLLVHRTDCDWWRQPGGGMESGETPWDGVMREVREETGFDVAVERLVGVYSWAPRKDEVIFSFGAASREARLRPATRVMTSVSSRLGRFLFRPRSGLCGASRALLR
jgi:ADP-ribose pyrophosphatase YjhB (NUDIX family)